MPMFFPKLAPSLISLSKILKAGKSVEGRGRTVRIYDHRHTYRNLALKENQYLTSLTITDISERAQEYSYNAHDSKDDAFCTWHKRLGHNRQGYMEHMVRHNLGSRSSIVQSAGLHLR